jgi:hypothetical protein
MIFFWKPERNQMDALLQAFQNSNWLPSIEPVTQSDMIATGWSSPGTRIRLSFTAKTGPFTRVNMYVPGSLISEQHHLNDNEKAAVAQWINSLHLEPF